MAYTFPFAPRVSSLKGSSILELAAKANQMKADGIDVVSLAAGEPDFNTPVEIRRLAQEAIDQGFTKYAPSAGYPWLRKELSARISKDNGLKVAAEEVVVTAGAKHAIYLALQAIVSPGDVVLVPKPGWVSYTPMIELAGGEAFPLPYDEATGFSLNVDLWKSISIPAKAKGIFVNSPNNPTGAVYSKESLQKLVSFAKERGLWILSDEIYEKITYDGQTPVCVASLSEDARERTITISGFSKTFSMTGWRFGWAVAPKPLIDKMANLQSQSNSHVTSFIQKAALAALAIPESFLRDMAATFQKKRDYCCERLDALKGDVIYHRPQGAFYLFVNCNPWLTARKMSELDFCKKLLNEHHLAVVGGQEFGAPGYLRFSYATSLEELEKGFDRFSKALR